jgi:dimeric dUTPase (all-alpha-NTP-PPase superfamily)
VKLILTQEEIIEAIREYLNMMDIKHFNDVEIDNSYKYSDEIIATVTYKK